MLKKKVMRERKDITDSFFILMMCLSLYDYQAKASIYRKGLMYLKNKAPQIKPNITFTKTEKKITQA